MRGFSPPLTVRRTLKKIIAEGLLYFEIKVKRWVAAGTSGGQPDIAVTRNHLRKLIKEARANVEKNGFTKEQADALELVLLRRLVA